MSKASIPFQLGDIYPLVIMLQLIPKVQPDWSIIQIVDQACPPSWKDVFNDARRELEAISRLLDGKVFYPAKDKLFEAFFLTPLHKVRVVIIGQDPYHDTVNNRPRAMGLAFSSPRDGNIPPSLRNIFKEIERTHPQVRFTHGDLTKWARQGVLLLNTSLTVEPHRPGSHEQVWMGFIIYVLEAISRTNPHCVYLLWGSKAVSLKRYIKGTVLISGHPSSMNRNNDFIGNDHFVRVNQLVNPPIDWQN